MSRHILKSRVCMHIRSSMHAHTVKCACTYGRVCMPYGRVCMHIRSSMHAHTVECAACTYGRVCVHTRVILKVECAHMSRLNNSFIIVHLLNGIQTIINNLYFNKVIRFYSHSEKGENRHISNMTRLLLLNNHTARYIKIYIPYSKPLHLEFH